MAGTGERATHPGGRNGRGRGCKGGVDGGGGNGRLRNNPANGPSDVPRNNPTNDAPVAREPFWANKCARNLKTACFSICVCCCVAWFPWQTRRAFIRVVAHGLVGCRVVDCVATGAARLSAGCCFWRNVTQQLGVTRPGPLTSVTSNAGNPLGFLRLMQRLAGQIRG